MSSLATLSFLWCHIVLMIQFWWKLSQNKIGLRFSCICFLWSGNKSQQIHFELSHAFPLLPLNGVASSLVQSVSKFLWIPDLQPYRVSAKFEKDPNTFSVMLTRKCLKTSLKTVCIPCPGNTRIRVLNSGVSPPAPGLSSSHQVAKQPVICTCPSTAYTAHCF